MSSLTCNCGHAFPEYLGRYGCPNCEGEAMSDQKNRKDLRVCGCGLSWYKNTCPECEAATPTKRPYAQPNAQRRSIYTDDETWAKLKAMGRGNASAGIREAVRQAQESQP